MSKIFNMKQLLKTTREKRGLMLREVAQQTGIDQALISKFESGSRKPTKAQLAQLAKVLNIDLKELTVLWLKERILFEVREEEDLALEAMRASNSLSLSWSKIVSFVSFAPDHASKFASEVSINTFIVLVSILPKWRGFRFLDIVNEVSPINGNK